MGRGSQAPKAKPATRRGARVPTAAERRLLEAALRRARVRNRTTASWLERDLLGSSGAGLSDRALARLVNLALAPKWPREYLDQHIPETCSICRLSIQPMQVMASGPQGQIAHDHCAPESDLVPSPLRAAEALALLRAELDPGKHQTAA